MLTRKAQKGFSLVEMMVAIVVLATMITLGIPAMLQFIKNAQLRTAAETTMAGVQLARAEALKRNVQVRFTLVDDIVAGCNKLATGGSWVVSLDFVDGNCQEAPSETTTPRILQAKSFKEGTATASVTASGGPEGNHTLIFNGLGRLVLTNQDQFNQVDISNPDGGECQHDVSTGTMRCLRIMITSGGDARMCDPKVADTTDPRAC